LAPESEHTVLIKRTEGVTEGVLLYGSTAPIVKFCPEGQKQLSSEILAFVSKLITRYSGFLTISSSEPDFITLA
jgi:hypothetical protein